jgi:hypothetical protein
MLDGLRRYTIWLLVQKGYSFKKNIRRPGRIVVIRLAAAFVLALVAGATLLSPASRAWQPIAITACRTISQPGSYRLAGNLTAAGDCLVITASLVTIDLAGFSITGPGVASGAGIRSSATSPIAGIAVRNGSIASFFIAVDLSSASASIVEQLRLVGNSNGIEANGIVLNNTVLFSNNSGMNVTGTVKGNYVSVGRAGISVGAGSTLIGNTVTNNLGFGIMVACPSNVTDNTATGNGQKPPSSPNLEFVGNGCSNVNNVAP